MKRIYTLFLFLFSCSLFAQYSADAYLKSKGEVYFKFKVSNMSDIQTFTKIVSIDNVKGNEVYAYANQKEYDTFLKYQIPIEVLKHPGDVGKVAMSSDYKLVKGNWNTYPTYDAYVQMMYAFEENNPNLCKIIDAGNTVQGRKILFAKISKNATTEEAEPKVMYSSSMHGDETTGYVLMLRLIDSLLTTYNTNPRVKNLLDNFEIWINPLANPDGTYHSGNSSVNGATRYNANYVDYNRNFPDPADGPHPDGEAWQPETIIMKELALNNIFTMSANFHGGEEVINYPWDTWARLHTDNTWMKYVSREFADTVHGHAPSSYMDGYDNGITNGYAWYRVAGGRQDFYTYFGHGREITMEISYTKLLSPSLLPNHWEYLKRSFLNYIEQAGYGIHGVVTDSITGAPIKAKIEIVGHDVNVDSSFVYSSNRTGFYSRLIAPGTYSVKVTAGNYFTKTITGVSVTNKHTTVLNIPLMTTNPIPVELTSFNANTSNNGITLNWATATETNNKGFEILRKSPSSDWLNIGFVEGNGTTTESNNYSYSDKVSESGKYQYQLKQVDYDGSVNYSSVVEAEFAPNYNYQLVGNYPNPFNPSTNIVFSIPVASQVNISLYNLIGQKVCDVTNKMYTAGKHEIKFNADNLSAGIYIYKMNAQGTNNTHFTSSRKMMLLK